MIAWKWRTVVFVFLLAGGSSFAQEGEEKVEGWNFLEEQLSIAADFETPHTQWGKPLAGGPIRALFFTSWAQGSTDPREIVELVQRFDIEGHAAYLMGDRLVGDGRPDWYGGDPEAGSNRVKALLDAKPDVIVLNKIAVDALPEWIAAAVAHAVDAGAGLFIIGADTKLPGSTPITNPPANLSDGTYASLGHGRVAILPAREALTFELGWETTFDFQAEAQGRALLWAANRAPSVDLTIAISDNPQQAAVAWTDAPPNTSLAVRVTRWDGVAQTLDHALKENGGTVTLPALREGAYHLDCFLRSEDTVIAWATAPFTVTKDRRIDSVALDRDWAEAGETIAARVALSGAANAGDTLEIRLTDRHNRILTHVARDTGVSPISLDIPDWAPVLLRVEAVLKNGDEEISYAYAYLKVTTRNQDQFNFVMWNAAQGDLIAYGVESLAKHGVTAILQGGPPHLSLAANNVAYVPYAASFRASSHTTTAMLNPETGVLKTGCVHDPEAMRKIVGQTVEAVMKAREQGVFVYSLGDENAVRASCLSPHCLEAYRAYLANTYESINALNAEWGSSYNGFNEIELLRDGDLPAADAPEWFKHYFAERQTLHRTDNEGAEGEALDRQIAFGDINDEMRALQAGNFARWYDRQAFQNQTYIEWCKQFQEAFLQIDPQALTGFEGTDSFTIRKLTTRSRQGGDMDAFVREMDYYGSYEGPGNEVMRSIAPAGFPMGSWIGYTPDVEELLFKYWQQVTDRMNTIQWWRWDNLDGYNGYLAPNLAPFSATQELLDDTRVVREGLGTLLMHCEMENDGIAMLYSLPSTYIAHFECNETYGLYKRDHDHWHTLLHDAGLQFQYVTDRMLQKGEVDLSQYKVLILPLAFAMSAEEAAAVRRFVDNGGTVIADVRPALYDSHCKPLGQGLLNDVFGVEQTGNLPAREIDRMYVDGQVKDEKIAMRWGNWHGKDIYPQMKVDPNVQVTTGKGLGEAYFIHYWAGLKAPMCIVSEFGKGRAILLNFSVFDAPMRPMLRSLLASAEVQPAVRVTSDSEQFPQGVEVTRWRNGDIELLAFLAQEDKAVQVELGKARYGVDIKSGAQLGTIDTINAPLRANRAAFFALLPKEPSAIQINLPAQLVQGETASGKLIVNDAAGMHPIRLRMTAPDGHEATWFDRTVLVKAGEPSAVEFPFAFNDATGNWSVTATNLLTQAQASATIALQ